MTACPIPAHPPTFPQAKHRARFWALADAFLASGMVPAYTAAAFVKRLARLALAAPPAGALLALGFMHNIVRRHPATMQLLHRPPRGGLAAVGAAAAGAAPAAPAPQPLLPLPPQVAGGQPAAAAEQQQAGAAAAADGGPPAANGTAGAAAATAQQRPLGPAWQGEDVYDYAEPDPAASRALESSLWELEALRCHHSPQVRGGGRAMGMLVVGMGMELGSSNISFGLVCGAATGRLYLALAPPCLHDACCILQGVLVRRAALPPACDPLPARRATLPPKCPPSCLQVAAYCSVLDKDLRDRKKTSEVDVGEALGAGYASMIVSEVSRRLKQVPTAFYRTPPEALFADAACAADWAGWAL